MTQTKLEDFKEFKPVIEQLKRTIEKLKNLSLKHEDKSKQTTLD
jgi:hypothetical protein